MDDSIYFQYNNGKSIVKCSLSGNSFMEPDNYYYRHSSNNRIHLKSGYIHFVLEHNERLTGLKFNKKKEFQLFLKFFQLEH